MDMTFPEIDAARRRAKLSARELCARAGVHCYVYYRARLGQTRPRASTLARLRTGLERGAPKLSKRNDADAVIRATFRGWCAYFAVRLGIDVAKTLGSDPKLRANASLEWRQAARARELSVYCTVTELDLPGARVARAIGVTRAAVSLMLRRVEDTRDDPAIEAMVEEAARLMSGREE